MKNKFKISSPFLSDFIPENIWEIFWICLPYSLRLYQVDILNLFIRIYCGHIWSKFKIYTLVSFKVWSQFLLGECGEEIKNIYFNINREQILNVTFPVWKCTGARDKKGQQVVLGGTYKITIKQQQGRWQQQELWCAFFSFFFFIY